MPMEEKTTFLKRICNWSLSAMLLLLLCATGGYCLADGTYLSLSQPGMKLDLAGGDYDLWIETDKNITDLQTGSYTVKGKLIYFHPSSSDIGDLNPSHAEILDRCRIKWQQAGIFELKGCKQSKDIKSGVSLEKQNGFPRVTTPEGGFPKGWILRKKSLFAIYTPKACKVREEEGGIELDYRGSDAWIGPSSNPDALKDKLGRECRPEKILEKGDTTLLLCSPGSGKRLVQFVSRRGSPTLVSFVRADNLLDLKVLSIALSSLKPLHKDAVRKTRAPLDLAFRAWMPSDGSFSIDVPEGWEASGGTADFGANGYIRLVQVLAPDKSAGFLGVYYPFYQFAQTTYGSNGIPPEDAIAYVKRRFFKDLDANYHIRFEKLRFDSLIVDSKISQQLNNLYRDMIRQVGFSGSFKMQAVHGQASYTDEGKGYEMIITGVIQYITNPLQGVGYSYIWGPAPIFVEIAQKGGMGKWIPVFEKIALSWQVSSQWLSMHQQRAAADARKIIGHYRKMAKIIHENAERRMNLGMKQWESENQELTEELWDAFYALGGEERYDNPQTGEEIDVPIGADKYLYDNYSQTWIGIREDIQGSDELVQHLKEKGFVELKKHRY